MPTVPCRLLFLGRFKGYKREIQYMFKTRFTELLGVQYPIQCGTMMFISNADFVAACANAGILPAWLRPCFPAKKNW